jgi:hypothetical protein
MIISPSLVTSLRAKAGPLLVEYSMQMERNPRQKDTVTRTRLAMIVSSTTAYLAVLVFFASPEGSLKTGVEK